MKKIITCIAFLVTALKPLQMNAQSQEAEQLLLNVEKLAQLKQILQNLYKGYEVLSKGYNAIKDISEGNFSLHKVFLDGLLEVSPVVRKYRRVADIVKYQLQIVKEYKAAFYRFRESSSFSESEIAYIGNVYGRLNKESLENLDDLVTVITAGQLRMSDDERLAVIDRIFAEVENQLGFLRYFNNSTTILAVQRAREQNDVDVMRKVYGIK